MKIKNCRQAGEILTAEWARIKNCVMHGGFNYNAPDRVDRALKFLLRSHNKNQ